MYFQGHFVGLDRTYKTTRTFLGRFLSGSLFYQTCPQKQKSARLFSRAIFVCGDEITTQNLELYCPCPLLLHTGTAVRC